MVADGMQSDQMRARTSGKMPPEFLHGYHIGAELSAFRYRQHDHADFVAAERILAPDVATIDQPFHRPLRNVIGAFFPFMSDPEQPLIPGELTKWCGHRLCDLLPATDKIFVRQLLEPFPRDLFRLGDTNLALERILAIRAEIG